MQTAPEIFHPITQPPRDDRPYLFIGGVYWPIEAWHDGKVYLLMAVCPDAPPVDQLSLQTFKAIQLGGIKTEKPLHAGLPVRPYPGDLEETFGNKPSPATQSPSITVLPTPAPTLSPSIRGVQSPTKQETSDVLC